MENFDTNTIDQYLSGQLNETDRQAVAAKIAADADFAAEVSLQKLTIAGIEQFNLKEISKNLGTIDQDLDNEGFFLTSADMDQVIDGEADDAIQQKLAKRLADDPDFKKEYKLHQLTREGISEKATNDNFAELFSDLDKDLEQEGFFEEGKTQEKTTPAIEEATSPPEAKVVRFPFRQLAIAASVALAIFAAWWTFQPKPIQPDLLYATYFQPPTDNISTDLSDVGFVREPYYDVLANGMKAYEAGKNKSVNASPALNNELQDAIEAFLAYRSTAPTTDEFYPYTSLYLAICYLKTNQSTEAAINLLRTTSQQNFPQQSSAKWYLALAYLKTNQPDLAKPILTSLENTDYALQAKELLNLSLIHI